jgi:Uma2 family endonuclease
MRVALGEDVFYPDVSVACGMAQAGDEVFIEAPVLIVEVFAQGLGLDQRAKFEVYRCAPSLREFVWIDPGSRCVELARRSAGDTWSWVQQTGALCLKSIEASWPLEAIFKGVESARTEATDQI